MLVFRPEKLAAFFRLLPRDTEHAAALARKHDHRLKGRSWAKIDRARRMPHCLEVRHPSFECAEFVELLREHEIGLVVADTAGKWPFLEDVTADFVYVRLHGAEELYVSGYTQDALNSWTHRIKAWSPGRNPSGAKMLGKPAPRISSGRDVCACFDNDVKVRAPYDALLLAHKLGLGPAPTAPPDPAAISETARTIWPSVVNRWRFRASPKRKPRLSGSALES